jgi:hypothetical protein
MKDDHDDLDRALFALPLEAPPFGMREAILRATAGAAVADADILSRWEIAVVGTILTLAAWLVLAACTHPAAASAATATLVGAMRALGEATTVAWLGVGAAIALLANFGRPNRFRSE